MADFSVHGQQAEEEPVQSYYTHQDELIKNRTTELIQINEQLRQEITERAWAEEALRRSEERYALAQRAANVGSWEREVATGRLYWSEQTEAIFGLKPGEFLGTYEAFLALIHPEDRQAVIEAAENSLHKGKEYIFEHRIIWPDQTVRWVLEQGNALRDEQGCPFRFTGIVQDITERKQAAEALQETHAQERYLRQVADSLREVSTILSGSLDLEVVLTKIFEQLGRVIRYEGGAIFLVEQDSLRLTKGIGAVALRHVGERVPLSSPNPVARVFHSQQLLVINDGSREPHWMNWPHKQVINAWIGAPLRVDHGLIGVLAVDRYTPDDPYAEEEAQLLQVFASQAALAIHNARLYEALRESEEKYRLLAEHSNDGVALFEEGRLTYASPAYQHIHGRSFPELIGLERDDLIALIHPDDRNDILSQMKRPDPVLQYTYRVRHREGHYVWVEDMVKRTFDQQGKPVRTIINTRGYSERKQLEEQLYYSQKMDALGRLAGGVAHHFNNLLTAIIGFIELGMATLPSQHPALADLDQAHTTSLRAAVITSQLMAFTRRQMIRPERFNVNDLVRRGQALLSRLIPVSITLTTQLAPAVGQVKIDENQFQQLLVNLVINACEAMPSGGHLTIQTANVTAGPAEALAPSGLPSGPYVRLTVSDTGVGISEAIQSRIFEPFFTTKDVGQGTGLGLSTCYGIVKQHGGEITVESQPGQGATFHVYLLRLEEDL